ncbi:hypothetical protein [uncultured Cohaesibacter sp.]|uniref:hypothetical protein n=1 Tax=uncultured Cohaesibacter sp. TaxID=1002546 RepID=UPI002AA843BD|nr:hypothetical protein [uncultured Cohaesibacter sp.]
MPTVKERPRRKGASPSDIRYRTRAKELRRGELDERLFRMRSNDASYEVIAKRLGVYPRDILARANKVYEQFEAPKDGVGQNGMSQENHYA